jgi:hypothetical protein
MSQEYTKGPWTLTHVQGSNFAIQKFEIRGMFGDKPNVYPIFNKDANAIDGTRIFCSPENARLIAAAPELLESLEEALNYAIDGTGTFNLSKAVAAVKKAKGETT